MALLPIHSYFIWDKDFYETNEFKASENDGGIYEVVRIIDGVPLFWEDHMERFIHSARLAGRKLEQSPDELKNNVSRLIQKNRVKTGNVLISMKEHLKAFFIAHRYPSNEQYEKGVDCGLLYAMRANPNAKVFQSEVRKQANRYMEEKGLYEVLLVDNENQITEGSRSNLFFIKGKQVFTPPLEQVLMGITRQKTIECVKNLGYEIHEKKVDAVHLTHFESAFITGTSPKILPIHSIEELQFDTGNVVLRRLMQAYDDSIKTYIKKRLSQK